MCAFMMCGLIAIGALAAPAVQVLGREVVAEWLRAQRRDERVQGRVVLRPQHRAETPRVVEADRHAVAGHDVQMIVDGRAAGHPAGRGSCRSSPGAAGRCPGRCAAAATWPGGRARPPGRRAGAGRIPAGTGQRSLGTRTTIRAICWPFEPRGEAPAGGFHLRQFRHRGRPPRANSPHWDAVPRPGGAGWPRVSARECGAGRDRLLAARPL